ncbi:transcriptional regulator, GntR family [Seinonella peptonophila]|uniref:Transcriptional regulator, GntR family n=1 Tax=Seinonella peptonophila TaxID=112248 RepID=A0A1M4ZSU3_9BACL|nr:GntR family transcriptional regulator [Seinonella peptonophila]SHF21005.1 transcriptional regulator, GntR family [Seinonella peptonophila]
MSNIPLYVQIAEHLRDNIKIGKWKEGERIPTEKDLCDIYNVSRITIRKAIDELVKEKLLYRERPKGTFVTPFEDTADNYTLVKGFTEEMKEIGKQARTLNVELEVTRANKKLAMYLNIEVGDKVLIIRRIRGDDDKTFAYFVTHIKFEEHFSLNPKLYYGSFYAYLNQLGISVNQEREVVEAILPNHEIKTALKIKENTPVLKRTRYTSCKSENFYEYTECYYVGNLYKYYLDFSL